MNSAAALFQKIKQNIKKAIIGNDNTVDFLILALLCGGHALICDVPGTGKTLLAKSLAQSVSLDFRRIQFTPDLLPSDITGIRFFNMKNAEFEFMPGPVFTNILLADEINRATPKTQAGLLECMAETQVTIEGETYALNSPFMVVATENPVESAGVFELPEAQADRFLVRLSMTPPSREAYTMILQRYNKQAEPPEILPVASAAELFRAAEEADSVFVHEDLFGYISALCEATHRADGVELGVSARGALALLRVSKCIAAAEGRNYLIPDDIKKAAVPTLAHRLLLSMSFTMKAGASEEIIRAVLRQTPVPTENFSDYRL